MSAHGATAYMKAAASTSGARNVKRLILMAGKSTGVPLHVAVQHNTMVYVRMKNKHGLNPYRDDNGNYTSKPEEN
jgi:hypothetical protein